MTVPFAPLLVSAGLGLAKDAIGTVAKALDPKAAQEAKKDVEVDNALRDAAGLRDRRSWVEARAAVKRIEL